MIKSLLWKTVAVVVFAGPALAAHGQSQFAEIMNAKQAEAHANLRKAIVALGQVRRNACYLSGRNCDLAKLSDIEIDLLDLETKYMRAANASRSEIEIEKFKKLKEAASAARDQISELADEIDKVAE